jgi:aminoglycoside phosphotransferase (APT) family kinase protein
VVAADVREVSAGQTREAPTPEALEWTARAVGVGATVRAVRPMAHASSSAVHAVDVSAPSGMIARLVLRRYVDPAVLASEPRAVEREAAVLEAVAPLSVEVPRVVAIDPEGTTAGVPALLMTRLGGRPRVRPRTDRSEFLAALARPLPELHALLLPSDPSFPTFHRYSQPGSAQPPPWTRHPRAWERAIAVHATPWPAADDVLIHRDYHPLNVLWRGQALTGIVDWAWACRGPRLVDVAHCRLNLTLSLGLDAADHFLRAWQACEEVHDYDPSWDLRDAVDALDLTDTRAALRRLDELVARSAAAL